ncbi:RNB domain-containing ribonuclease [Caedibacter taeniospiralis]|uniref:RNB domain-containing ribonuclease n=1 Tax=Caedibacter taeniospiralis TaxID=28907 RepID=UPI001302B389|nr:RNB domain-containing ribonuclease [Caedibacter taeniospiralis]
MQVDSLVIFKGRPARVIGFVDKKVEIELEDEKTVKLPEKNLLLLHEGGFKNFKMLSSNLGEGEFLEAWNLLQGTKTDYDELSELIYGEYNCVTAYATWQHVQKALHFYAEDGNIGVNDPKTVEDIEAQAREKQQKAQALEDFIQRVRQKTYAQADEPFIKELESYALGQSSSCRFFKFLDKEENLPNAHMLLLDIGFWDEFRNPYPQRLGVSLHAPQFAVPETPKETRLDLTHLASFAIDDEDSHDPDDALSFDEQTQKLWVHVADPACVVTPESEMDKEARVRGSNLYLPEGVSPMLPHQITHDLALGLHESSPALSIGFRLIEGQVEDVEIALSTIKVTRLSYKEAENRLNEQPFSYFARLADEFSAYRKQQGAVELQFPEVKIKLKDKKVELIALETLRSRHLVRDAMLMAGVAVATFADKHNIPLPFSTQPDHDLTEDELSPTLLSEMFGIRRRLQKGQYKSQSDKHAGMGLTAYVQATSPLRRYLDLVVHQQLRRFLKNEVLLSGEEILTRIGESESGIKAARQAESFSNNHWKCVYLLQNPEWQGNAIVIEKQQNNRVTVFIPALSLIKKLTLVASIELDDSITVKLAQVKLATQDVYFHVINQQLHAVRTNHYPKNDFVMRSQ